MTELSPSTLATIARALLAHRTSRAKAVSTWEARRGDPHAPGVAASCRAELDSVDRALIEFHVVVSGHLGIFLKSQIDLIHPPAAVPQPVHQEAAQ